MVLLIFNVTSSVPAVAAGGALAAPAGAETLAAGSAGAAARLEALVPSSWWHHKGCGNTGE